MKTVLARVCVLMVACVWAAGAQAGVEELDDGTVVVTTDAGEFVLPKLVAESVVEAVDEHGDDPEGLRSAIMELVAEHAGSDGQLATAIGVFAASRARSAPAIVDAILRGVSAGNATADVAVVLATLPELKARSGPPETAQAQLARLQATVENPAQVSPVEVD